jgi:hypothetical protein
MTMPRTSPTPRSYLPDSLSGFIGMVCASALVAVLVLGAALLGPALLRKSRADRRASQLEAQIHAAEGGPSAPRDAAALVEAQLERLRASVPAERRDLELIDQLRAVARRAGAARVLIAPPGGVLVPAPAPEQGPARETLLKREPSQLQTDLVTFTAEGRYAELVAFLRELAREPGLKSVEAISVSRRPPRISWTLTLKAARW